MANNLTKPPLIARPTQSIARPGMNSLDISEPRSGRVFTIAPWTDAGQGQKILLYGPSGIGKTTLAAMAPNAVFIGLDDGGRKTTNPKTGEPVKAVSGIETFADLRTAVRQTSLFPKGTTLVIDTVTKAEVLAEQYTFDTVKAPEGAAKSLEDYGYNRGYRFLTETFRLLLADLDPLVKSGVNILFLAQQGQTTVANLEGVDYLEDGPKLYMAKNGTGVRGEVIEWCDFVMRIGHPAFTVIKANPKATKGKVSGESTRVIYTTKELHFQAKARMVKGAYLEPVISFDTPDDDSLWRFLF